MGDNCEARIAGVIPNITPTETENAKASKTDHQVTCETNNIATIKEAPIPRIIPIIPPKDRYHNCFQ